MGIPTSDAAQRRGARRIERGILSCALSRNLVLALAFTIISQSALAQAMYRIKPLGYLGGCRSAVPTVAGLNGKDEVAGTACNANGDTHAFLWRNDGKPMVDLGPDEVGSESGAFAINSPGLVGGYLIEPDLCSGYGCAVAFESYGNGTPVRRTDYLPIDPRAMNDHGQMTGNVGICGTGSWTFLWSPEQGTFQRYLGGLDFGCSSGEAINDSGQVAGYSATLEDEWPIVKAVVWNIRAKPIFLGTLGGDSSKGLFINGSGQVAGTSDMPGNTRSHVFFWRNDGTRMQNLGTLGGANSYPNALNDSGQIAGYANKKNGDTHAFVWMNDGTGMKDLGTFGGTASSANDINFSGQVTGSAALAGNSVWHAFLWRNDGTRIQDLNALIDPTDPLKPYVTLTDGAFINDAGNVLGYGTDSRTGVQNQPYLLQGTVLTLNPRSLAFGSRPINTTSAAKSVTVRNTSAKPVAITSIALAGSAPGQFAFTHNCGKSLAGHATCTIKVTFRPTTRGKKRAILNVNGGGGGLRSVTLTGTGT